MQFEKNQSVCVKDVCICQSQLSDSTVLSLLFLMPMRSNLSFTAAMFKQLTCKKKTTKKNLSTLFKIQVEHCVSWMCGLVWGSSPRRRIFHHRRHRSNSVIHFGRLQSSISMTAGSDSLKPCWRFSVCHSNLSRISASQSDQSRSAVLRPPYTQLHLLWLRLELNSFLLTFFFYPLFFFLYNWNPSN